MRLTLRLAALACLVAAALPAQHANHDAAPAPTAPGIPLYREVLGPYTRDVHAATPEAQAYWTQGMQLLYAFAKAEAVRSFQEAQRRDSTCAMCWWGEAQARGPYLNGPMNPADGPLAYAAARRALALAPSARPAERALIAAIATRYLPTVQAGSRKALDSLYARELAKVHDAFPADDDVSALYAESLMLLEPRREAWSLDKPSVARLIGVLDTAVARHPEHPGACHLYVHATESTPRAGGAEGCAELLGSAVPGVSHINHMPSHTFNRIGRWDDAVRANLRAWATDQRAARGSTDALGVYPGHNLHMLLYSASQGGQRAVADSGAREYARITPGGEYYLALVRLRFGRFDEVLAVTSPSADPLSRGMLAFARGYAQLRQGRADSARIALTLIDAIVRETPDSVTFREHPITELLRITGDILRGELQRTDGDLAGAIATFERAVAAERALHYDEPEPLNFSASDWLGATLLEANRAADAERAYRAELVARPKNGWSLTGLRLALERQGRTAEAAEVQRQLDAAWARADVKLSASRF